MRIITESADTVEQKNLAKALEALGLVVVANSEPQVMTEGLVRPCEKLCFNFKRIRKKDVYHAFLDIYVAGGIEASNDELINFLANFTNLGSESSVKTLFYRYKRMIHV